MSRGDHYSEVVMMRAAGAKLADIGARFGKSAGWAEYQLRKRAGVGHHARLPRDDDQWAFERLVKLGAIAGDELSARAACEIVGCKYQHVIDQCKTGKLKSCKVAGLRVIRRDDLLDWMRGRRQEQNDIDAYDSCAQDVINELLQ